MGNRKTGANFSPEMRERAVRLVLEAGGMADWDDEDAGDPDDGHAPPWATRRPGPHPPAAAPDPARLLRPPAPLRRCCARVCPPIRTISPFAPPASPALGVPPPTSTPWSGPCLPPEVEATARRARARPSTQWSRRPPWPAC